MRRKERPGVALAILMVSPQFRPLVGGYERSAERLSRALADAGLHVVVITERRERVWPAVEAADNYEVRRLPCLYRRHLHTITSLLSFGGFLLRRGRGFDVWHVHQHGFHAALAVALGKALHRPVVLKLTSSGTTGIELALGNGIVGSALRFFHRRVSACLATTDETRAEAIHLGIPPSRVQRIPNGVDGDEFQLTTQEGRLAARLSLGLDCERLVLFVGRLSREKNPLGLLDAWAAVDVDSRERTTLAVIGDGPDRAALTDKVRTMGLETSVHIAGARSDVATWYRAADFYVTSSLQEGLSNTMIEAMASGLPVISTRVSGSSVLLESPVAGCVVDVDDAQQLADAIATLLRDADLRAQLGTNARRQFESHFALANVVNTTIALYATLHGQKEC